MHLHIYGTHRVLTLMRYLADCPPNWGFSPTSCVSPHVYMQESLGVKKAGKALLYTITCPVGPYFSSGLFTPISLYANPRYVRAWIGGTGDAKIGG